MITVLNTASAWPNEVLKINYIRWDGTASALVSSLTNGRYYPIYPAFAKTVTSTDDKTHNWVSFGSPVSSQPSIIHGSNRIIELNVPVSAATPVQYSHAGISSASYFVPVNDHASLTYRIFAGGVTTNTPDLSVFTSTTVSASTKSYALELLSISGASASYIVPSHLIFCDFRAPSAIKDSNTFQIYTVKRPHYYHYIKSYPEHFGRVNASSYDAPFEDYNIFTSVSPLITASIENSAVSALQCTLYAPKIYRHINTDSLTEFVNGDTSYSGNLFNEDPYGIISNNIKPGSILIRFGYEDPNVTSSLSTVTVLSSNQPLQTSFLTPISSNAVIFERNHFRIGYIRDTPVYNDFNPTTGYLIGRAGVTNEIIVNSAASFVNYQTGDYTITLSNGYSLNGNALYSNYYNRVFREIGGYPSYKEYNKCTIDQNLDIDNPVKYCGNKLYITFDTAISDLSSVVDIAQYPSFGTLVPDISFRTLAGSSIPLNTTLNFEDLTAVSVSSTNAPLWLFTYKSSVSSPGNAIVNGMDMCFNMLSAQTSVSANSAFITPVITNNYGTITVPFSTNDAYYGYLQLNCKEAVELVNNQSVSHDLSVNLIDYNNNVLSSYPIELNSLDLYHPYKTQVQLSSRSVEINAFSSDFTANDTPLTLKNVAYYFNTPVTNIIEYNKQAIQLWSVANVIQTNFADNSLSLAQGLQGFINKLYKYINECINPNSASLENLADTDFELSYKFNNCGSIYKSFYETFNSICKAYVLNTAKASNTNTFISVDTLELCTAVAAQLQKLAIVNENALTYNIASQLFDLNNLINSSTNEESYNFIVDVLTESFILAALPGTYNISSVLRQNEITYDSSNFSIVKKLMSLGLEKIFRQYTFALNSARNSGVYSTLRYNEVLDYLSNGQFELFSKAIYDLKQTIGYSDLIKAKINKTYIANTNKNTAYNIFQAEQELDNLFNIAYAIRSVDTRSIYYDLFSSLNLIDHNVKALVIGVPNAVSLVNRINNQEIFETNSLSSIQKRFGTYYYNTILVPLSSRFCIVSPASTAQSYNASYELKMYSEVIGSDFNEVVTSSPSSYLYVNNKFNKEALTYTKPTFLVNKYYAKPNAGLHIEFNPLIDNDKAIVTIIPDVTYLPPSQYGQSTIMWNLSYLDTDAVYAQTWLGSAIGSISAVNNTAYPFALTAVPSVTSKKTSYIFTDFYNQLILNRIGVNPVTINVSVSSPYLGSLGSNFITNNLITASEVFYPLAFKNYNTFAAPSSYPTNTISSNVSVVSADYTAIDNPILLRNWFVKNNRIYNPPLYENVIINTECVYGSPRIFKSNAQGSLLDEVTNGTSTKNSSYYKIKTLMNKTLDTYTPPTDKLKITFNNTPTEIINPVPLSASLNFFQYYSNLYSKFTIGVTSNVTSGIVGNNGNTDLIVALTATSQPVTISFTPLSSNYLSFNWIVSGTSAYNVSNNVLTISSSMLSSISAAFITVSLSTRFNYLDGVTNAILISDPVYIYPSNQVVSSVSARAWTIFQFTTAGATSANELTARIVNTSLTTIGHGHTELLALCALGSDFNHYAWQVSDSAPIVTTSKLTSAIISRPASTTVDLSLSAFGLQLTGSSLSSISAFYDDESTIVINAISSKNQLIENEAYSVNTVTSSITSDFFKNIEFLTINTPVISSGWNETTVFYKDVIDINDITLLNISAINQFGEYVLSADTKVRGTIYDNITEVTRNFELPTFSYTLSTSSFGSSLDNLDLFNCSLVTLSSTDTIYTKITGSQSILKTDIGTRIQYLTAIKLPEFNIFWDSSYHKVNDQLIIKNNNDFDSCYNLDIGFNTLSVTFNGSTQIVPVSTQYIIFDNLDNVGVYSIDISASTLSAVSSTFPVLTASYENAITVVNDFDVYNPNARIINEQLELPYSFEEILINPNEYAVAGIINHSLSCLYENYKYLKNKSIFNDLKTPVKFDRWLGTLDSSTNKWRTVTNWIETYPNVITDKFKKINDIKVYNDRLYVAHNGTNNSTILEIFNLDTLSQRVNFITNITTDDEIGEVTAFAINNQGIIYILDKPNNSIYSFKIYSDSPLSIQYLNKIGGLGNASKPYRFNNPTDLQIDKDNRVYIVDQDNDVVKVYNDQLKHLATISHKDWILNNDLISVSTDLNGNIFVLRKNNIVYIFDSDFNFVKSLENNSNIFGGLPKKILCNSIDTGIVYIVYDTHISKITNTGDFIGYFKPLYHPYVTNLQSIAQNGKNILIADINAIYNTVDFVSLKPLANDITDKEWSIDSILINDNEIIQDWVYNVSLRRIADNLDLFVKNLHSKLLHTKDINGVTIPSLISLTTSELPELDFEQVIIGQNELVFADVVNRALKQLWEIQKDILQTLDTTTYSNACKDNWCWTWAAMGSTAPVKKNCTNNPITFLELQSNSPSIGGKTWNQMKSNDGTCCEVLSS